MAMLNNDLKVNCTNNNIESLGFWMIAAGVVWGITLIATVWCVVDVLARGGL